MCMANIEVGTKASLLFMAVVPHLLIWDEPRFWWAIYRHNPTHSRTWPNDSFQSGTRWVEHQPLRGQSSSFPNEEFSLRTTASCNGRSCLDQKRSLSRNALQGGWKRGMATKSRAKATVHSSVMISFHTSTSNSFICPASGWAMKKSQSGMWQTFRIHSKPGIWPTLSTTDGLRKLNFPKALCECYLDKHGEPAAIH